MDMTITHSRLDRWLRARRVGALAVGLHVAACSGGQDLVIGRGPSARAGADASDASSPLVGDSGLKGTAGAVPNVDMRNPVAIDHTGSDNPAGLSESEVERLVAGGPLGDLKWLYPYDGTVFPRGTLAPAVMWNGNAGTDALYLRIKSQRFEYKTVLRPSATPGLWLPFGASSLEPPDRNLEALTGVALQLGQTLTGIRPTQLLIPKDVWDLAGQMSLGKGDPFTLELTERVNGQVRGPLKSRIYIAQATLKGSVYYSSCLSAMQGEDPVASFFSGGKVLRIPAGSRAELVLSSPGQVDGRCQGCHSVSANGARLIAQSSQLGSSFTGFLSGDVSGLLDGLATRGLDLLGQGMSYQLDSAGRPDSFMGRAVGPNASYGALYPDGSKYLSTSGQIDSGLAILMGSPSSLFLPPPATLYDAQTGAVTGNTGVPASAAMPMFSPDGTLLVFNDAAVNDARSLVVMDYDTKLHKGSRRRILLEEDPTGAIRPGWPFVLPDNRAVVFTRTDDSAFSGSGSSSIFANAVQNVSGMELFGGLKLFTSDLYIADLASRKVTPLAKAMGFNTPGDFASDATYLPFGAEDLHRNFFPTVSPVAAGGYFWVFFDSYRHYGSLGVQRQLWGFAVDIRADGNYTADPSHPPFYLPGQEFGSSNHRAFAALDRCRPDGAPCRTGIDCCAGACSLPSGSSFELSVPTGTCSQRPPDRCAKRDEHCSSSADCCNANDSCINGFCAFVELL